MGAVAVALKERGFRVTGSDAIRVFAEKTDAWLRARSPI